MYVELCDVVRLSIMENTSVQVYGRSVGLLACQQHSGQES